MLFAVTAGADAADVVLNQTGHLSILNNACWLLLVLDAAFDCVDHRILLQRLHSIFGLASTVIDWLRPDGSQQVSRDGFLELAPRLRC